ncbi:hypothetical protein [Nocardioides marmorisolisilvae]|uniref:Uncharacterized protein n=1 Tax=Nocardioides marmorisolisilvae TaxID=1542737 RepID=A0A3N0DTR0_9ACTN|nr:hypothetical protein [Nocardioides marmorisolisilvae]RNL78783.1 hypothetical protein EFL95_06845 [Nocardioides marmorisolisilvae]
MAEPQMTALDRVAFVATLVWVVCAGAAVPVVVAGVLYGKVVALLAGMVGGYLGYRIHRYAWADK